MRLKFSGLTLAQTYPWILTVGGAIGFAASFILAIDKFHVLKDPAFQPLCSINPVLSCTSVASTWQAEVFGFPNMFIGIAGFSMVMVVGMALLAGASFKPWFWRVFMLGPVFGAIFIHWLSFQSVYRIGALCINCMIVWSVTMPIFLYSLLYVVRQKYVYVPVVLRGTARFIQVHHGDILGLWYLLVIGLILHRFWYYFGSLL